MTVAIQAHEMRVFVKEPLNGTKRKPAISPLWRQIDRGAGTLAKSRAHSLVPSFPIITAAFGDRMMDMTMPSGSLKCRLDRVW